MMEQNQDVTSFFPVPSVSGNTSQGSREHGSALHGPGTNRPHHAQMSSRKEKTVSEKYSKKPYERHKDTHR